MDLKTFVTSSGTAVEESNDNIFADRELPNPEERLLKTELALQIRRLLESEGLTQTAAARLTGVPQPHLSDILSGKLTGYPVEKLLTIINRLGRSVEVRVSSENVDDARTEVMTA